MKWLLQKCDITFVCYLEKTINIYIFIFLEASFLERLLTKKFCSLCSWFLQSWQELRMSQWEIQNEQRNKRDIFTTIVHQLILSIVFMRMCETLKSRWLTVVDVNKIGNTPINFRAFVCTVRSIAMQRVEFHLSRGTLLLFLFFCCSVNLSTSVTSDVETLRWYRE